MQIHTRNQNDSSKSTHRQSTLTNKKVKSIDIFTEEQGDWLINKARPECLPFIRSIDEKISDSDSQDIFSDEAVILCKNGMKELYSPELVKLIRNDQYWPSDQENLHLLKYHLKHRRVIDFFRKKTAAKRDYRKLKELSDHEWAVIQDGATSEYFSQYIDQDTLMRIQADMKTSPSFDKKDKAILRALIKSLSLNTNELYDAISHSQRNLFHPRDNRYLADPEKFIKTAIRRRKYIMLAKIRSVFDIG